MQDGETIMEDRKRILTTAILAMVSLAVVITATGTAVTYRSAMAEKKAELQSLALRQVQIIEAILEHDSADHSPAEHRGPASVKNCPLCSANVTLAMRMLRKGGSLQSGWGEGVEFVVGTRAGDSIRLLLRSRHPKPNDDHEAMEVPWQSQLATPMRMALSGMSGIVEAEDYCGMDVLAAYAPVAMLGWGIVAKVDKSELQAPFATAIRKSLLLAAIAIVVGLVVLGKRLNPLIQRSQDSETKALDALAKLKTQKYAMDEHSIVAITDPSGRITYTNDKFCQISQYSREELIGQTHRIVNSGHHSREFFADMWATISGGETWRGEVCNRAKDGSVYWVDTTIVPFKDAADRIEQYVAIRTEITDSKLDAERISIALSTMKGGMWDWNIETGEVIYSTEWCRELGYDPVDVEQHMRFWKKHLHPDDRERVLAVVQAHLQGDSESYECEYRIRKKDGTYRWNLDRGQVVARDEDGKAIRMVGVDFDISSQKHSEERLRKTNEALGKASDQAQVANRAKSNFLANMSHEIRTPMTAILGFAENMLDPDQSDSERLSCVHTIRRNGDYLIGLINDILDLSKIEAGKMTVEFTTCNPCGIIAEVASLMRVRADATGLPLNIEYIGAIPATIQSDPTRLRQILINLIGNAFKFTEEGAVRIITRFVNDPDAPCLQFDVADTGRGMTDEQVAQLYQPFTQADESTTRKFGGTGLGLTISKRFAEMLGGEISVASTELGVGTTFRVRVATGKLDGVAMLEDPLSATVVTDPGHALLQAVDSNLQGIRILLAEDGPDNQRLISFLLKKAGAEVTVEENGKLALDTALAARDDGKPFDVILMDMQMPVLDGYKATKQLRKQNYLGSIIALTAHAMASDRQKCIAAGCDDYATKPIDRKKLIDLILQTAPGRQLKSEADGPESPSDPSLHGCRVLLAEDNPTNQFLIVSILKKIGAQVTAVKDGRLAVDAANAALSHGRPFDVILMDIQMPLMGGDEATKLLRKKGYTGTIISLTANSTDGDQQRFMNMGFDDSLWKPIDRVRLIETIRTNLPTKDADTTSGDTASNALISELADDEMHDLVESFVTKLPEKVAAIESAVGEKNLSALAALAHQLKGSAGGYGFPTITEAAKVLEVGAKSGEELQTLTKRIRTLAELCGRATSGLVQRPKRQDEERAPASSAVAWAGTENGTVLVVDDDPDTRRLFRSLLERDGFEVHEACDGASALSKLRDIHPHVILMDVEMPNMDGFECTRKLKADPALRDIPVIIVSGKANDRHVRSGLEAGAQEYITKPIQHDEFLLRVRAIYQLCCGNANLLESNAIRGEQARAMEILFDLSRTLAAASNLDAIAQNTVAATADLMSSSRVSVMLPDATGENLFVACAIGIDEELAASIQVPMGSSIAGEVFASGEPAVFNDQDQVIKCTGPYESDFFASIPLTSRALAVPNKVVGVLSVTERHDRRPFEVHEIEYLDLVCNMAASAIEQFQSGQAREHAHAAIVIGLAKLAEHRDSDTGTHLERVTQFALLLARELRKSPNQATTIDSQFLLSLEQAMPLHDIGKVSVSDAILLKPGKLTDAEFSAMKRHTTVGVNAIQSVIDKAPEAGFLLMARDIAQSHHEWFDGTGYPQELAGDEIPLAARIAAVADVYDALTSARTYKEAFLHAKAAGIIRELSGSQFDPDLVDAFIRIEQDLIDLASKLAKKNQHHQDASTSIPRVQHLASSATSS